MAEHETERPAGRPAGRNDVLERLRGSGEEGKVLVGMIHLPPLPGAPGWSPEAGAATERAVAEAEALAEAGFDAVLVENFGDAPFHPGPVPPETVAALAIVLEAVRGAVRLPVGVNVLRNDARSALGLAAAADLAFIRVNVHVGTMFTDQGALDGRAHETLRVRSALAPRVLIAADVHVKHAVPPPGAELEAAAADTRARGLADVLIVSGTATGRAPDPERIRRVRTAAPDAPLWVGSGLTPESAPELLALVDGAIVGSAVQRGGRAGGGVDPERAARLVAAAR